METKMRVSWGSAAAVSMFVLAGVGVSGTATSAAARAHTSSTIVAALPAVAANVTLPPGPAYTVLSNSCQGCHSLGMILQNRLSVKGWTAEVTKMHKWGAPITAQQQALLVPYLARYLGPKAPPQSAPLVPPASTDTGVASTPARRIVFDDVDARHHVMTLRVIAAYTGHNNGFNFDGDDNGKMVVSVPAGYTVEVTFSNKSQIPHSALVTPFAQRQRVANFALAFKGSSSANPGIGIGAGPVQHFRFVADRPGRYALVCAVPGHEAGGMWDTMVVTRGGRAGVRL